MSVLTRPVCLAAPPATPRPARRFLAVGAASLALIAAGTTSLILSVRVSAQAATPQSKTNRAHTPRVAPKPPAEWTETDREILGPFLKSGQNAFKVCLKSPGACRPWIQFTSAVGQTLPIRDRELLILRTAWLEACSLLIPYGTQSALELDVLQAFPKVVVDDWKQCGHDDAFGALRPHVRAGLLTAESLHAELGQVVAGLRPGRERADERILFWHRGLATTDVALAHDLVRRAEEAGIGTRLRYRS